MNATIKIVVVLLVSFLVMGCGATSVVSTLLSGEDQGKASQSYKPTEKVIVTRDDPSLPDGCRPREVAGLITNFFDAFNRGDQSKLSRFFVQKGPSPGLYNAGPVPGKGFGTYYRDALLKYFAERHEHEEHLRLLEVAVGKSWRTDRAAITVYLTRTADDIEPGLGGPNNVAIGKGEIDCGKRRFVVWNMWMASSRDLDERGMPKGSTCPESSGPKPGQVVIACARNNSK